MTPAVSQQTRQRVSLKRENFAAGGVLPEGDYQVIESSFVIFQYTYKSGATGATTTAHRVVLRPVAKQGNAWVTPEGSVDQDQNYSVGDVTAIVPSEDGNFLEAIGTRTTLGLGSNFFLSFDALLNAGMPEDKWDANGAKLLVGMIGHITHIPEPDRSSMREKSAVGTGGVDPNKDKKKDFPRTIPVFKAIHAAPWDSGKKTPAPVAAKPTAAPQASAPTPAAAPVAAGGGDDRVAGFIRDVIVNGGGRINQTTARLHVHRKYNTSKIDASTRDKELEVFNDSGELALILGTVSCAIDGGDLIYKE